MSTKAAAIVFRDNLRRLLKDRGLTQKEAALQIGIDYQWLRKTCANGISKPQERTKQRVEKIRQFFGIERTRSFWSSSLKTEPRAEIAKYSEQELEVVLEQLAWAFRLDPRFPHVRKAISAVRLAAVKIAEKQLGESSHVNECTVCGERLSADQRDVGLCNNCDERTHFEKYAMRRDEEKGDGTQKRRRASDH